MNQHIKQIVTDAEKSSISRDILESLSERNWKRYS